MANFHVLMCKSESQAMHLKFGFLYLGRESFVQNIICLEIFKIEWVNNGKIGWPKCYWKDGLKKVWLKKSGKNTFKEMRGKGRVKRR